jgi:hypothetical protein
MRPYGGFVALGLILGACGLHWLKTKYVPTGDRFWIKVSKILYPIYVPKPIDK